jgi:hypothetical protein
MASEFFTADYRVLLLRCIALIRAASRVLRATILLRFGGHRAAMAVAKIPFRGAWLPGRGFKATSETLDSSRRLVL